MNCINETIIGLSDTECDCFDADKPADFNTSVSVLFITDHIRINDFGDLSNCGNGSIWDIMNKARKSSINQFAELTLTKIL